MPFINLKRKVTGEYLRDIFHIWYVYPNAQGYPGSQILFSQWVIYLSIIVIKTISSMLLNSLFAELSLKRIQIFIVPWLKTNVKIKSSYWISYYVISEL